MERKIEFILRKVKKAYSLKRYPLQTNFKGIQGRIMKLPKGLIGKYVLIIPITDSEKQILHLRRKGYNLIDDVLNNPKEILDKILEEMKCEKKRK